MIAVSPPLYFQWRCALLALALLILALTAIYFDTASGMVEIWIRSGTFTHAFLVPPITLWLIWEKRALLGSEKPHPDWKWLAVAAVIAIAWLLGDLAAVNAVTQTAFVAMIVCSVPLVLGSAVAAKIVFPLCFLFFAVPIGEFIMPRLMDWTATVTVLGLRASGIPVYQEGLHFVIPSGRWSVIEACSGVRYLIASLCVGTLFAYLNYRSWRRRLLFVAAAMAVPVVANWIRAYGIVMMGHLSGNELAVGVDHLIYGWFFFGIVIMAMFAVGLRWREDLDDVPAQSPIASLPANEIQPRFGWAAIAIAIVAAFPVMVVVLLDSASPLPIPGFDTGRLARAGWNVASSQMQDWTPAYANPTATRSLTLEKDGHRVGVFVAFYQQQGYGRKLISSDNKLAKSDDANWALTSRGAETVKLGGRELMVRTAGLRAVVPPADGEAKRLSIWYWHRVGATETINDPLAKVWLALAKLSGRGDASAAIFVFAEEKERESAQHFLAEAGDGIADMLDHPLTGS